MNKDSKGEVSFAQPEMVNKSERDYLKWKKPDVTSIFKDNKLVFEIQLATTFLDVICERQHFYKENQSFIIWVFKNFEIEADKQRFTQKDIFYSNNRNAFVLDDEAIRLSNLHNDLFLLCQYQNPKEKDEKIVYEWEYKYVNLSDLTFDITSYKVYYYDVDKSEYEVKLDIENKISKREEAERLIREKHEKLRLQEIENRKEAQELIEIEKEKLRSQEIERLKQHEKNKSERQKALDEEKKVFINLNASFKERLQSYQNLTPLQKIFKEDLHELNEKLKNLFVYGYTANQDDKSFLKKEYELELKNKKDNNRLDILYFLALSIFYIKLSDTSRNYDYFSKIERVLFAILSIKEKRNIGYNFKTLVEIPNLFFNPKDKNKIEFSSVILEAINVYYGLDRFLSIEDSKGNFKRKLEDFLILRPNQEVNYNQFIKKVFKDLKI